MTYRCSSTSLPRLFTLQRSSAVSPTSSLWTKCALHSNTKRITTQQSTTTNNTVVCNNAPRCTVIHINAQHSTVFHNNTQHCINMHQLHCNTKNQKKYTKKPNTLHYHPLQCTNLTWTNNIAPSTLYTQQWTKWTVKPTIAPISILYLDI